jgi:hypothetical protein
VRSPLPHLLHSKLALKGEIHTARMRMGGRRADLGGLIDGGHVRQKNGGTGGGGALARVGLGRSRVGAGLGRSPHLAVVVPSQPC